jgi:SAM-dependent methyltransferase
MTLLQDWLKEPSLRKADPDAADHSVAHREILRKKRLLQRLFLGFYRECRELDDRLFGAVPGLRLELGSGSSFFREAYPDVIASDIKPLPFVQLIANAEALPLRDFSARALYAINVFHHLPRPRLFFRELLRVLRPGGGIVMIEPYHGPLARFLFRRMHASEGFDPNVSAWETPDITGPMSNANQALSYLVFARDRLRFEAEFPQLEIVLDRPHTQFAYLLSGGVNFRQLAPEWLAPAVLRADAALSAVTHAFDLQHTLILRRRAG